MSASLRQLKCITFDVRRTARNLSPRRASRTHQVTGTLVSFRGSLGHHYVSAAARCGINVAESPCVYKYIEKGFGDVGRGAETTRWNACRWTRRA